MARTTLDSAHQLSLFQDLPTPEAQAQGFLSITADAATTRLDKPAKRDGDARQGYERRIFQLEQALDQALTYLTELVAQVDQQRLVEEKLTITEDYAFVQYQAIAHFQKQLAQYKDTLSQTHQTVASLEADKAAIQTKLLLLQQDRQALYQENSQWKQAFQELQQECDRQHHKISALEQENTVMQEQILQQVCQSNEYETAVRYWQDQCRVMQEHFQSLLASLESQITAPGQGHQLDRVKLHQIVQAYITQMSQAAPPDELKMPPSLSASVLNAFTIPDFLIRRYQNRSKRENG